MQSARLGRESPTVLVTGLGLGGVALAGPLATTRTATMATRLVELKLSRAVDIYCGSFSKLNASAFNQLVGLASTTNPTSQRLSVTVMPPTSREIHSVGLVTGTSV